MQSKMDEELMLSRLVENGLDFLNKAIDQIKKESKYSVIHFHAAVELFLKSRLLAEHWTLVISHRGKLDWTKFTEGNFQSVSLGEASDRLSGVVRSGLIESELQAFCKIRIHRNKMIHFYHEAHGSKESGESLRSIVKEELIAWYYLHELLTERWKEVFRPWLNNISSIHRKFRKLSSFLEIVFDQIESNISESKLKGSIFKPCPSCGFESQQHEDVLRSLYRAKCLVCGLSESWLKIECPECSTEVLFKGSGFGKCQKCSETFHPADLVTEIIESEKDLWEGVNCSDCGTSHTVIKEDYGNGFCANCFAEFDTWEYCKICGEANTGDMEESGLHGCNQCEGINWAWEEAYYRSRSHR